MTDKQALAYAKHELEYYKQVERDGIKMIEHIDFYGKVVDAFEKQMPKEPDKTRYGFPICPNCGSNNIVLEEEKVFEYCPDCSQHIRWR